jgi:hypothetical protein
MERINSLSNQVKECTKIWSPIWNPIARSAVEIIQINIFLNILFPDHVREQSKDCFYLRVRTSWDFQIKI